MSVYHKVYFIVSAQKHLWQQIQSINLISIDSLDLYILLKKRSQVWNINIIGTGWSFHIPAQLPWEFGLNLLRLQRAWGQDCTFTKCSEFNIWLCNIKRSRMTEGMHKVRCQPYSRPATCPPLGLLSCSLALGRVEADMERWKVLFSLKHA